MDEARRCIQAVILSEAKDLSTAERCKQRVIASRDASLRSA
jgi:hypothetical protein